MQQAIQVFASKFHKLVNPKQTASEYMMSGMLLCRLCGAKLTIRNNTHKGIAYYVCTARKDDGVAGCELTYINIKKFDKQFLETLLEKILAPEHVQALIEHIASELSGPYEQQAAIVLALEDQIRKAKDQQVRVMTAYEEGAYPVTDFTRRIDPLRRAEAELEVKKQEAERQLDQQAAIIAKPETVLAFAKQVESLIKHSTPKQRKQTLQRFVKCVWVTPPDDNAKEVKMRIDYPSPCHGMRAIPRTRKKDRLTFVSRSFFRPFEPAHAGIDLILLAE